MADFPIDTYLAAFQQKYANEQAAKPDIAKTLANSINQGANVAMTSYAKDQELQKQRAWEGYQAYTKDKNLVTASDGKEAPFEAVLKINDMVLKGNLKMKGDKDGSLILADSKGTPLYRWEQKQVAVSMVDPFTGQVKTIGSVPQGSKTVNTSKPESNPEYNRIQMPDGTYLYENPYTGERSNTIPRGAKWKNTSIPLAPGEKPLPAETAGKLSMLQQGSKDLEKAQEIIFKDGELNDTALLGASMPFGGAGEEGKKLYSYIYNAIEGKLRTESGAAVPESEVKRMANRFIPKPALYGPFADTDKSAQDKLIRLKDFLDNAAVSIDPQGKYIARYKDSTVPLENIGAEYENTESKNTLQASKAQPAKKQGKRFTILGVK